MAKYNITSTRHGGYDGRKENNMQAIVKTNYNGKEERQVIEMVTSICQLNSCVSISYVEDNGDKKTQYIALDGYTEIVLR